MATLLAAARGQSPADTAHLAATTVHSLDALRAGGGADGPFTADAALVHLRSSALGADPHTRFVVEHTDPAPEATDLPAESVRRFGAALAEAVRNSRLHAGQDAHRTVTVSVDRAGITVRVGDDGTGFDPAEVPAHRLGPGAAAVITSRKVIYTFMCARGRTVAAWVGMLAVCVVWAARSGQGAGYGIAISLINLALLVMASFFTWTIRPAARRIFALHRETTLRVAVAAADTAALAERDRRLRQPDEIARPLLARIARGYAVSADDRIACQLLEAHLRDTLRALALDTPALAQPVREARARGVEVVLLDDRGMDDADEAVRTRVHGQVARLVAAAEDGTLTVRVLPPGQFVLATILDSGAAASTRIELGHDGLPVGSQDPDR